MGKERPCLAIASRRHDSSICKSKLDGNITGGKSCISVHNVKVRVFYSPSDIQKVKKKT